MVSARLSGVVALHRQAGPLVPLAGRAWGIKVAQRPGMRRAIVAGARRLAVVLHRMWADGTDFLWGREPGTAVAAA